MSDYLDLFLNLFLSEQNQLWLMFFSGFLSSTLLPGNSEIVFSALVSQQLIVGEKALLIWIWLVATLANSLGSFTTYFIAFALPQPKTAKNPPKTTAWAIRFARKYGALSLLFSWLPLVGDLLCGVAGWLKLPFVPCALWLLLGKAVRYGVILATLAWAI